MRLHALLPAGASLLVAAAAAAAAQGASSASDWDGELSINGWYPCSKTDELGLEDALPVPFECAEVRVPLCWDDVCESDKTIDLFVRRLPAVAASADGEPTKAVWFLQGGPGGSSTASTPHISPCLCLCSMLRY
jgi:hypothetical protein